MGKSSKDVTKIAKKPIKEAKKEGKDIVIPYEMLEFWVSREEVDTQFITYDGLSERGRVDTNYITYNI